jgi:hypothetical protein
MRRWLLRSGGLALVLAWGGAGASAAGAEAPRQPEPPAGEPFLAAVSPDLQPRLERERFLMLPSDAARPGLAEGLVLFSQPHRQVWQLLTQTERQREYRPELVELTRVERFANGVVDRHRIRVLFIRLAYHLRYELDPPAWHIAWSLDPHYENGIQQISGSWDLYDMRGDRTLGRFGTTVRVGAALPRSLQDAVTRKNVPETLDNVRLWVDSGGEWRP